MPFLTINDIPVFYTITPPSPIKTITLFIHGLGSSSCFYQAIIPSLLPLIQCIALDTPGSGLSALPKGDQSIQSIAKTVIDVLNALKIKDVVVVGHSMGGIIASYLAAEFPGRVKGVVLLGPVAPARALADILRERTFTIRRGMYGLEPLADSIPVAATGSMSTPLHHAFIRSLILATYPAGYISLCNVITEAKTPWYENIKVPVLILAGEDDKTASLASSKEILKRYGTEDGKKELRVLEGVGHWHCIEAADEVAEAVDKFVIRFGMV